MLALVVLAPVVYMLARASAVQRNVAYQDDIDGTLMLLVRLQDGGSFSDGLRWMLEVNNEHRMATSRLLYVLSYFLTGTVNFAFFGAVANLFLCGLCALLVRTAGATERKWSMALLLAALMFQLQHYENFFWSGSAIDHFQVPLLAGAVMVLLARRSAAATAAAAGCALLATFTLAHGLMLWPVGVFVLAQDRRWTHLSVWTTAGIATGVGFFLGFDFNPAHQVGDFTFPGLARIGLYWLEVMGAPFAFGHPGIAAAGGLTLLGLLGWQYKNGGFRRERIALPLALWAVAALALMAIGRGSLGGALSVSRYYVLAALAWALAIFAVLQQPRETPRTWRTLAWLVPALFAFNLAANVAFDPAARGWIAARDRAVADFDRTGRDGQGPTTLHPLPQHATRVIRQAEELGVFEMPRETQELNRVLPQAQSSAGFSFAVDRVAVGQHMVTVDGWAALAGRLAAMDDVEIVLRSAESQHVLNTRRVARPDVAAAFPKESWRDAGFHFALRSWLLPPENFQLGLLIHTEHGSELMMTPQRVDLTRDPYALESDKVAPNRIVYDELFLRAATTTVTAAPKKFTRVTFFDVNDGLVHVDLCGAGEMTVSLADAVVLDPAPRERGRAVAYIRGLASIAIKGADESTNLSIFVARRQPQRGPGQANTQRFDGMAHVASLTIDSRNGKFGGVRAGNARFVGASDMVGIQAPGVRFAGPVNLGDIAASGEATPRFELGFARDTRVIGGDLHQPNGRPVLVSGIMRLRFVEGRTAQGTLLPARRNEAVLLQNGRDVSLRLAGEVAPSARTSQWAED